jgi:hypothetical protein
VGLPWNFYDKAETILFFVIVGISQRDAYQAALGVQADLIIFERNPA